MMKIQFILYVTLSLLIGARGLVLLQGECPIIPHIEDFSWRLRGTDFYSQIITPGLGADFTRCQRFHVYPPNVFSKTYSFTATWISNINETDSLFSGRYDDVFNAGRQAIMKTPVIFDELVMLMGELAITNESLRLPTHDLRDHLVNKQTQELRFVYHRPEQDMIAAYACFDASEIYHEFSKGQYRFEYAGVYVFNNTNVSDEHIDKAVEYLRDHGVDTQSMIMMSHYNCDVIEAQDGFKQGNK